MSGPARATWIEIDLEAVLHNHRAVGDLVGPGVRIYACLKGNAYGCGVGPVATALALAGADAFAVGDFADATEIRRAGCSGEVLLYPNCMPDARDLVVGQDLTITVSSREEAEAWSQGTDGKVKVFLKVDVGAFRAGALPAAACETAAAVQASPHLDLVGVYAHLALPDPVRLAPYADWQFSNFKAALASLAAIGIDPPVKMVSGTAAVLQHPEMDLNAVDPGRMLFGLGFAGTTRRPDLRSALVAIKSRLLMVKSIDAGDLGGFAPPFEPRPGQRIGLIPIGWKDGVPKPLPRGLVALVHGRRVPLLGPSHFEHLRVDLTDVPEAGFGDEVVLLGSQGGERIEMDEVACTWAADPLHFLGTLPAHVPRRYVTAPSSAKESQADA